MNAPEEIPSVHVNTLTLELFGCNLSPLVSHHQSLLSKAPDDLPLAEGHAVLGDLVRANGSKVFACRIPDDPRGLTVWQSSHKAAMICTYWRQKLGHVDLVLANERSVLGRDLLDRLMLTEGEIKQIESSRRPLLVMCKVRRRVRAVTGILGIIAFLPVGMDVWG